MLLGVQYIIGKRRNKMKLNELNELNELISQRQVDAKSRTGLG
jgi:hypothetical protein